MAVSGRSQTRRRAAGGLATLLALLLVANPAQAQDRAWELVGGTEPGFEPLQVRAWSSDGDRVAYASLGPMPGAVSGEVLAHSAARRTEAGWTQMPIGQPFTVHEAQLLETAALAVDQSISSWLWGSAVPLLPGGPEGETGIYRRTADATLTLVGSIGMAGILEGLSAASADIEHIGLNSSAALLPADTGRTAGRGFYEIAGPNLRFAGVDSAGEPLSPCGSALGDGAFQLPANSISRDGSRIFIASPDPNTSACGSDRVYLREAPATTEISVSHCSRPDCGPAADVRFAGASADGSNAYLTTTGQLTDDDLDDGLDLYRYTAADGALVRLSAGPPSTAANLIAPVRPADNGDRVYFVATGRLIPGEGTAGGRNLYLRHGGETHFIATLAGNESLAAATTSADGGVLLFVTTAKLAPGDLDAQRDVYRYEATTETLTRISAGTAGEGNGPVAAAIAGSTEIGPLAGHRALALSADGFRAFLQTTEALAPEDINESLDVYEWAGGSLTLLTSGTGDADNDLAFNGLSADGRSAFVLTRQSLLPDDSDGGERDLYAARLGGGFPQPPPAPTPCEGDSCQGPLPPPSRLSRPNPPSASPPHRDAPAAAKRQRGFAVRAPGRAARRRLARSGRARLLVRVPAPGRIKMRGTADLHGRPQVVARAAAVAWRAGRVGVTVRLSRAARRLLRRPARRLRVRLVARYSRSQRRHTTVLSLRSSR